MALIDELSNIETSNPTAAARAPRRRGFDIGALGRALQLVGASGMDIGQLVRTGQAGQRGVELQNLFRLQEAERRAEALEQQRIDISERAESREEREGQQLIKLQSKRLETDLKRVDLEKERLDLENIQLMLQSGNPELMVAATLSIAEKNGAPVSREKALEIVNTDPAILTQKILSGQLEKEIGEKGVSLIIENGMRLGLFPRSPELQNRADELRNRASELDLRFNEMKLKEREELKELIGSGKFDPKNERHKLLAILNGLDVGDEPEGFKSTTGVLINDLKKAVEGGDFFAANQFSQDLLRRGDFRERVVASLGALRRGDFEAVDEEFKDFTEAELFSLTIEPLRAFASSVLSGGEGGVERGPTARDLEKQAEGKAKKEAFVGPSGIAVLNAINESVDIPELEKTLEELSEQTQLTDEEKRQIRVAIVSRIRQLRTQKKK